jgi:hypothetical protein
MPLCIPPLERKTRGNPISQNTIDTKNPPILYLAALLITSSISKRLNERQKVTTIEMSDVAVANVTIHPKKLPIKPRDKMMLNIRSSCDTFGEM